MFSHNGIAMFAGATAAINDADATRRNEEFRCCGVWCSSHPNLLLCIPFLFVISGIIKWMCAAGGGHGRAVIEKMLCHITPLQMNDETKNVVSSGVSASDRWMETETKTHLNASRVAHGP